MLPNEARLSHLSPERLAALQDREVRRWVREEATLAPFYQRAFVDAGIEPRRVRSLADLDALPTTRRADVEAARRTHEREHEFEIVPDPRIIRACWSFTRKFGLAVAGSRGAELLRRGYGRALTLRSRGGLEVTLSSHDIGLLGLAGDRLVAISGIEPGERVVTAFPDPRGLFHWQFLVAGIRGAFESVHAGDLAADDLAREARSATTLALTPTRATELLDQVTDGALPRLRRLLVGGEAWSREVRCELGDRLRAAGCDADVQGIYAPTEARMVLAECPPRPDSGSGGEPGTSSGYHLYPDALAVELLDPVDDRTRPAEAGAAGGGEVTITTVAGHGTAFCRYRTGDLAASGIERVPCPHCGRNLPRLGPEIEPLGPGRGDR